jgi:hypothetical protein
MDSHSFLNPAVQTIAAFAIFVTGFLALFVLVLACVAVVGFLYWSVNRLAILLSDLRKVESMDRSMEAIALPAPARQSPTNRGLSQAV